MQKHWYSHLVLALNPIYKHLEVPAGAVTLCSFKEQEAICQLSWRSAPVCFTVCLTDLYNAFKSNISRFQTLVQILQLTPLIWPSR